MSVANIGKLQENFAAVQDGYEISQHEGHHFAAILLWFRSPWNWPSTWSDRFPMDLTPSFQLRIMHLLKRWITDFWSFETKYSMHNLSSRKFSKCGWKFLSYWMLHVRFLFASPPCIHDLLMAKDFKASKLWFFMCLSFPLLCHGFQRTLLNLGLLWWSNY